MIDPRRCLLLCCFLPLANVHAQGSLADYERAAQLGPRTSGNLVGESIAPQWTDDGGTTLWYVRAKGKREAEYVLVDCETGTRSSHDVGGMVAAVKEQIGAEVGPLTEPTIALAEGSVYLLFGAGTDAYRFDLRSKKVEKIALADALPLHLKGSPRVLRSRPRGGDTAIVFANGLDVPLSIYWVDEGGDRKPYGVVEPGKTRRQHTMARHSWVLVDEAKRDRAAFVAQAQPKVAWIGPDTPRPGTGRGPRAGRRGARRDERPGAQREIDIFIRDHDVWLRDRTANDEVALTTDGTAEDGYGGRQHWSPDGTKVVAMRTVAGEERKVYYVESAPRDQLQPKLHSYDYRKPGDRIPISKPHLFDVEHRREIPIDDALFENPWRIRELRWATDGSHFTFGYNQRGHQVLRIVAVDAATGQARAIVEEKSDTFIDYSQKQFAHFLDATDEIIWSSERDGWNHLYLYDARTGEVRNQITRGEWVVRGVERVDDEKRQVWFRAGGIHPDQDPYHVHYARVSFDGSDLVILTEGDGTHEVSFSPTREYLVDRYSRVDLPPITELRRAADGSLICELERADWSALLATGWRPPERFVTKGRDGTTDIWGMIRRPTNHDPKKSYPVIESIYAGPHGAFVPKSFRRHSGQSELAELGFIVVQIDGMGTNYRSKAFHDVCWKNVGDSGFPDRILWIKAAAARDPSMDLSRVGIYGGSAGGQSALRALLAHGDFYHAAVTDCGCHDNRMDKIWWNEAWMGWPIGPHYEEQSNVTQAHRLTGKLLLIVGEKDENVDPASTMQVVDALIRADKDFDLLVVPGAGHGAGGSRYGRRRQRDFFVRNLLGVEPRWE